MSPNRQKSPNRQAEHKPNVRPSKDDSYAISKESAQNSRKSSILNKSLRTKQINKQINKQEDCPRTVTQRAFPIVIVIFNALNHMITL